MKYLYILLFTSLCFLSCSKDENNEEPPFIPQEEEPKKGNDKRPVEWLDWKETAGDISVLTSMTFVADSKGIEAEPDSLDIMAAFINGQCRGCAQPQVIDDKCLFFLTVNLLEGEDPYVMVTYRYYSHSLTKIYETVPSRFVSDDMKGTINNPYHFNWIKP